MDHDRRNVSTPATLYATRHHAGYRVAFEHIACKSAIFSVAGERRQGLQQAGRGREVAARAYAVTARGLE